MIQVLRARHRWMTGVMAVLSGGVLVAGLVDRPAPALMETLPTPLRDPLPASPHPPLDHQPSWSGAHINTTVYPDQLTVQVVEPLRAPAPLLYWSPTRPTEGAAGVPDGARLLGMLDSAPTQRFAHPAAMSPEPQGYLLVFSLGRGQVIATASLEGS